MMIFPSLTIIKVILRMRLPLEGGGNWWSAALLIEEPKSEKKIIMLYKWQKTDNKWKLRSKFKIGDKTILEKIKTTLDEYANRLP